MFVFHIFFQKFERHHTFSKSIRGILSSYQILEEHKNRSFRLNYRLYIGSMISLNKLFTQIFGGIVVASWTWKNLLVCTLALEITIHVIECNEPRISYSTLDWSHSLIRGVLIQSFPAGAKNFTNYVFCHPQFSGVIQNIENHCAILTPTCLMPMSIIIKITNFIE